VALIVASCTESQVAPVATTAPTPPAPQPPALSMPAGAAVPPTEAAFPTSAAPAPAAVAAAPAPAAVAAAPASVCPSPPQGCPDNRMCHAYAENKRRSADGWCDNCAAHCAWGTEAECTQHCRDQCDRATGGFKSDACPDGKTWQGCLNGCGGVKGCRNSWCDQGHPERDRCHADADRNLQADLHECDRCCPNAAPIPPPPPLPPSKPQHCKLDPGSCAGKTCEKTCKVVAHCDCDTGLGQHNPHCWCEGDPQH